MYNNLGLSHKMAEKGPKTVPYGLPWNQNTPHWFVVLRDGP